MQQDKPEDFVIATGKTHSVREFAEKTFQMLELDWEKYVQIDPRYNRPAEVDFLQGDAEKARTKLNWKPKTGINELVKMMVEADRKLAKDERILLEHGEK